MPNIEIASLTAEAAQSFRVEKYIVSAVWCLGRTYYNLDSKHHLTYANLQQASQLFNPLSPDNVTQRLGGQCRSNFVDCAWHVDDQSKIVLW